MDRDLPRKAVRQKIISHSLRAGLLLAAVIVVPIWLTGMLKPTLEAERIRTSRVERGVLEAVITAAGIVQPATEQVLPSPIGARVIRVLQEPGTLLETGQAIVELDKTPARLELSGLDEKITQTQNRKRELELDREEALLDLLSRREIQSLDVEQTQYELEQNQQLSNQGLVSESSLRQVETRLKKARIQQRAIQNSIDKARQNTDAKLARLDSELRALHHQRLEAQRQLELATLRAERPGVLTWVVEEEGVTAQPGEVLARLADLDSFGVEGSISDIHSERLRRGMTVHVNIGKTRLDGRIARVMPTIDAGAVHFRVALEQPGHPRLRSNLRVEVLVVTERKEGVLRIAKGPYVIGPGQRQVLRVEGQQARRLSAQLGLSAADHYEVVSGLEEGDTVIVSEVSHVIHMEEIEIR